MFNTFDKNYQQTSSTGNIQASLNQARRDYNDHIADTVDKANNIYNTIRVQNNLDNLKTRNMFFSSNFYDGSSLYDTYRRNIKMANNEIQEMYNMYSDAELSNNPLLSRPAHNYFNNMGFLKSAISSPLMFMADFFGGSYRKKKPIHMLNESISLE